jgi:hypothetical protein
VADFGLARALDSGAALSGGHQIMGTPHYFSPEQARGLELDGRSDLYALGVTLFRSATGRLPYEGDDWIAVARLHVEAPIPSARELVPELSEGFDAIVTRLLQKAPADRFPSATALADALVGLPTAPTARNAISSGHRAIETVSVFPPVTATVSKARRGLTRWLGASLAIAIVVAAIWLTTRSPDLRTLFATPPDRPITPSPDSGGANPPGVLPLPTGDTTSPGARNDSTRPAMTAPRAPDSTRRRAVELARSQLTFIAPDAAMLYVDGVLVGRGMKVIDRPGAARIALKAVIADAPPECTTAARDSIVLLAVGERRAVTLSVRTCLAVTYSATAADTRVRFESLDGGQSFEVAADTVKQVILLPEGKYEVRATAPRCLGYRDDTLVVRRGASGASLTRSIRMTC